MNSLDKRKSNTKWVSEAFAKNKGALHRSLGVKPGDKIPLAKLSTAANSDNGKLAKRAQLALTASKFKR